MSRQAEPGKPFYFVIDAQGIKETDKIEVYAIDPKGGKRPLEFTFKDGNYFRNISFFGTCLCFPNSVCVVNPFLGQISGSFIPDIEGEWKVFVELKRGDSETIITSLNFGVLVKTEILPSARILGITGKVYVGMGTKCFFDLVMMDKDDVIVSVIYHDTPDGKQKVIPLTIEESNSEFFVAFTPTVQGRATIDVCKRV